MSTYLLYMGLMLNSHGTSSSILQINIHWTCVRKHTGTRCWARSRQLGCKELARWSPKDPQTDSKSLASAEVFQYLPCSLQMESYWRLQLEAPHETGAPATPFSHKTTVSSQLIATKYGHPHLSQLLPDNNGWEAKLHQYLTLLMMSQRTQTHCLMEAGENITVTPCSHANDGFRTVSNLVPGCSQLLSISSFIHFLWTTLLGQRGDWRWSWLGTAKFEDLKMIKFTWRSNIGW